MSLWIGLVVIAQLINAGISLLDKFLVTTEKVGKPITMTFYVSILSSLTVLVFLFGWIPLPFENIQIPSFTNLSVPTLSVALLSIFSALAFLGGLYTLFSSYKVADVSDVVPVVNSVQAVFIFILSFYVLNTSFTTNFFWGFIFLVVGMLFLARFRFSKKLIFYTLLSGLCFAIHFFLIKILFIETVFDNAFFWSRIAIVLTSLLLLLFPSCCSRSTEKHPHKKKGGTAVFFILLGNKMLAGLAGFLILKAIEFGDVALVQAMAGLQFVFLLAFSVFVGHKTSIYCGENCTNADRVQKIVSTGIIIVGFILLFI